MNEIPTGAHRTSSRSMDTRDIARACLKKACSDEDIEKDSRGIIDEALGDILESSKSTVEEKTLAQLGRAFRTDMAEPYPAQMSMLSLMRHLAAPMQPSGPVGMVIGKECVTISGDIESYFNGKAASIDVFTTGFKVIAGSPQASKEEKTFAELGMDAIKAPLNEGDRFLAGRMIMDFLGTPHGAPIGSLILQASMASALNMGVPDDITHVLDAGFRSLEKCGDTTEREKTLARFGKEFGGATKDALRANVGKVIIMDSIAKEEPESLGSTLSRIVIDVLEGAEDPEFERDTYDAAFKTIAGSPLASEKEKLLAAEGLKNNDEDTPKNAAARKFLILKKISAIEGSTGSGDTPTTIKDDNRISIDGVTLDVNHAATHE
jgi:hypothetical protein